MVNCRLLPYAVADGPHNMAADEVLLESALASVASLRFYGWSEATLSLGYFQSEQVRHSDARLARLPYVRRPSGGAALVHHHEVTYTLALPGGAPWQSRESWLRRMHAIIAEALGELQVTADILDPASAQPFRGVLCFEHLSAGDLLLGSAKVVGSAQRRRQGALMQHGSILLASSPYAPALPGIQELSGREPQAQEVCAAVQSVCAAKTGWNLVVGDWTDGEARRKDELVRAKYMRDTWNRKR